MKRSVAKISDRWYNVRSVGFKLGSIPCTLAEISLLIFFISHLFSRANLALRGEKERHILQQFKMLKSVSVMAEF